MSNDSASRGATSRRQPTLAEAVKLARQVLKQYAQVDAEHPENAHIKTDEEVLARALIAVSETGPSLIAVEFGYRCCEKGMNLQAALHAARATTPQATGMDVRTPTESGLINRAEDPAGVSRTVTETEPRFVHRSTKESRNV